ncbi:NAD(P)H-binding protein [Streptomyces sp. NPDC006739]|uniref:NAD(P)H-binding protein n=1 Tax=Streptomyces sp. NPDC006739 TaxID=3364763 RepID=UPI00369E3348
MILVTGATGVVGGEVARVLASSRAVRVLCRDPGRLAVRGPGLEVAVGSYEDRASLSRALDGVEAVFLVTTDPGGHSDERFLEAAVAAGVRHVVKLSAYAVGEDDADDLITRWQRGCEASLRSSGLAWTLLRPRSFMSNTLSWAASIRSEGVVPVLFPRSRNACVDPRDVARAAVAALTSPGHEGRVHPLTGPEAISAEEQIRELASALGRPLACRELTPDQAAARWARRYPPEVVRALVQSARRQARGGKTTVDPAYTRLTGHRPRSYREWALDHRTAFGGDVERPAAAGAPLVAGAGVGVD